MKEGFVKLGRWIEKGYFKPRGVFILGEDYCYGKVIADDAYYLKSIDEIVPIKIEGKITIGLDIEFELVEDDGRIVYAGNRIDGGLNETIGVDGSSMQVEFRPHYATSASQLICNLEDLLCDFFEKYDYDLSLRGDRYPLGAHIHIGYPYRSTEVNQAIAVIMDFLYGKLLKYSGDARGSYRRRLQWRRQDWGVEYRSLPTYIFRDKILAEYILTVLYKAVKTFLTECYLDAEHPAEYIKKTLGRDTYKDYLTRMRWLNNAWKNGESGLMGTTWVLPIARRNDNHFRDDWDSEVKSHFRRLLASDDVIGLTFFGFKRERGLVSNIEIEGFQKIDWDCPQGFIGLPWEFRNLMDVYGIYNYNVLDGIRKYLRERIDNCEGGL